MWLILTENININKYIPTIFLDNNSFLHLTFFIILQIDISSEFCVQFDFQVLQFGFVDFHLVFELFDFAVHLSLTLLDEFFRFILKVKVNKAILFIKLLLSDIRQGGGQISPDIPSRRKYPTRPQTELDIFRRDWISGICDHPRVRDLIYPTHRDDREKL